MFVAHHQLRHDSSSASAAGDRCCTALTRCGVEDISALVAREASIRILSFQRLSYIRFCGRGMSGIDRLVPPTKAELQSPRFSCQSLSVSPLHFESSASEMESAVSKNVQAESLKEMSRLILFECWVSPKFESLKLFHKVLCSS
jgi:hypothetical protein